MYRTYIQTNNYYYYPFSKQKLNGVKLYENNASGSGELRPVPPVQPGPTPEVHNNLVETTEDSNVIDISWDTALDEENGENKGPQEEITENNDIEVTEEHNWIENTEDTITEQESSENEGSQEEVEEHQINVPEINVSTAIHKNTNSKSVKVLPSIGEEHKNTPTLAILLTVIGSVLLFRRKSKFNKVK